MFAKWSDAGLPIKSNTFKNMLKGKMMEMNGFEMPLIG